MSRTCTFFMLLKATAHWHALDRDAQREVFDQTLMRVFNGYPELRMSHFASTALGGRCTDVVVWETSEIAQYDAAIGALHRTPLFALPLFEIVEVIHGIEDDDAGEPNPVRGGLAGLTL